MKSINKKIFLSLLFLLLASVTYAGCPAGYTARCSPVLCSRYSTDSCVDLQTDIGGSCGNAVAYTPDYACSANSSIVLTHATLLPGDNTGLTSNMSYILVADKVGTSRKCEYACDRGYIRDFVNGKYICRLPVCEIPADLDLTHAYLPHDSDPESLMLDADGVSRIVQKQSQPNL